MSSFDHGGLMHDISHGMGTLRQAQPAVMQAFGQLSRAALAEGAVSARHKELIALAIGVSQHCSGCIAFHVKALLRLGCTRAEFDEALAVCVYMGGGPSLMYAAEASAAWEALAPQPQPQAQPQPA